MRGRVFNHTAHKALWDWLSKTPDKGKAEWPEWTVNGGSVRRPRNKCFACQYAKLPNSNIINCDKCPLLWPKSDYFCCTDDIYDDWYSAIERGNYKVASLLAEEIRDLPVREGVKCK